MTELPTPLTPADCDLRDFPFMPLQVSRLRRSRAWLLAKRTPELAFFQINLWTASWHDFPAASLENDDDVLADLAMCDPKRWAKIKDEVLRGWVLCADQRWYHPVVAENAVEAWKGKLAQRWRSECGAIKKRNQRNGTDHPLPEYEEWFARRNKGATAQNVPVDIQPMSKGRTEDNHGDMVSKRERQGKGQRKGQGQGIDKDIVGAAAPTLPKIQPSDDDFVAARWMRDQALVVNPTAREPNLNGWANDVRLMRERDKRTHREICDLFQWAKKDTFWSPNIQSPGKLREKWDQLTEKRILAAVPRSAKNWWSSDETIVAKCAELNLTKPQPGESMDSVKARIEAAIANGGVAPVARSRIIAPQEPGRTGVKPEGLDLKALVKPRAAP